MMRILRLVGRGLLFVLIASPALARDVPENLTIRTFTVPLSPGEDHPLPIYVSGQVVTTLRFEAEVDPAKTKLVDWEGRFEPLLVGGKKVVLEPLHNLGSGEALPLLVTLVDGTQCTFLVKARSYEALGWTDVQLNVFKHRDSYDAMLSDLYETKNRERDLREENGQLREEVNSVDSAMALLLANGEETKKFRSVAVLRPKNKDMDTMVTLFSALDQAAAVIQLTNTHHGAPWRLDRAYLTQGHGGHSARPFAIRMDRPWILPGEAGTIAVVVGENAFATDSGELADLVLEIFGDDGLRQAAVAMNHKLLRK